MMMPTGPCKDCTERHYACWGECAKYQEFRKELEKYREAEKQESFKRTITSECKLESVRRRNGGKW